MKLQFPVYLIGGPSSVGMTAWLKSKLDENEYLFVFTSAELAKQFIQTKIKNDPKDLQVVEIGKEELSSIQKLWRRSIERIVVDIGTAAEVRMLFESALTESDD